MIKTSVPRIHRTGKRLTPRWFAAPRDDRPVSAARSLPFPSWFRILATRSLHRADLPSTRKNRPSSQQFFRPQMQLGRAPTK